MKRVGFGVKVADFFEQLWCCCNTLTISKESPIAERIAWFATQRIQRKGGLAMSIAGLTSTEQTTVIKAVFAANDVRALIANHLGVSVSRVTDEAHFTKDLGADWLDRLELMMAVEDQFAGVEITDADVARRPSSSKVYRRLGRLLAHGPGRWRGYDGRIGCRLRPRRRF